jgi:spermidine synthase
MNQNMIWEGDTPYGHYQVIDTMYDGRPARVLYSGNRQAAQSGVSTDDKPELLFDYNQRMFELATNLVPKTILLIGGGVGTLPTALLEAMPSVRIHVVEPDIGLTDIAYDYFDLPVDDRLSIFNTDGRSFLRGHAERYDLILVDAFMHTSIPRELQTIEAFKAFHSHLNPAGVLAMNVISAYHGPGAYVIEQLYAAAMPQFAQLDIFLASRGYSLWLPQNFVLTAQKDGLLPLQDYVRHETIKPPEVLPASALTDEDIS